MKLILTAVILLMTMHSNGQQGSGRARADQTISLSDRYDTVDMASYLPHASRATRLGKVLFVAADVFVTGAGCTYGADRSIRQDNRYAAAALLATGLGLGVSAGLLYGGGMLHEHNLLANPDNEQYIQHVRVGAKEYVYYYGPAKHRSGATKVGEVMLIAGGSCVVGAGILAAMAGTQDDGYVDGEVVMMGVGLVCAYYGGIIFGSGKIADKIHNGRFSLVGGRNRMGVGMGF